MGAKTGTRPQTLYPSTRFLSNLFKFPIVMVNFRDPAKIARDFCAYTSSSGLGNWGQIIFVALFHRDCREAMAHHRWPIHVS